MAAAEGAVPAAIDFRILDVKGLGKPSPFSSNDADWVAWRLAFEA
jgi:hypothetical protein